MTTTDTTTITTSGRVAILARFKGPTDTLGSRIVVQRADIARRDDRAALTVSWEYGLSNGENYEAAVAAYLARHAELGNGSWAGDWVLGGTVDGATAVRIGP
jgi:hypothetical protein